MRVLILVFILFLYGSAFAHADSEEGTPIDDGFLVYLNPEAETYNAVGRDTLVYNEAHA